MEFNPYESPDANFEAEAVWSEEERKLWQIALWQKYLMWFLLIFFGSNVVIGIALYEDDLPVRQKLLGNPTALISTVVYIISWCVVTFSLVKMELIRHGTKIAAAVVIGMLVPVANLFILLGINGSATSFLRKFHVRVGLFGAEMGDIRRNLQKKVGEADPDKVDVNQLQLPTDSMTAQPMVAQAIPVAVKDSSQQ